MRKKLLITATLFCVSMQNPALAQQQNSYMELGDFMKIVYKKNPSILAAREELEETKELYPQARSGWLPNINGEASIYATDIESSNFSEGTGATTKDITLSVDQPIWRGGRTFAETAQARKLIHAGRAVLRQAEQDIFLQTASIYMNLLRDKELLDLRIRNEKVLMKELKAAWERMDIGDITDTDVQQAKARLSRAKTERIEAQRNYDISKAEFEEIVGVNPPEKLRIPYMRFDIPSEISEMIRIAQEQNPEILMAHYEKEAADHGADATFRELLPQISAFASYNKQYDPQPGIVESSETETIGLRARISFYSGGATRSRIREAKRNAKRHDYEIQEMRRQVRQEVISNWRSYETAKQRTENTKQEIDAAEKALTGVREEARLGQRTVLDILDADKEVIDAKTSLANARRDEIITKFALANSLGMLTADRLINAQ